MAINERNMSDNALEELSLAREPRMGMAKEKSLEAGEANLPKFSEWAAGRQSSLDTDTLSQHVTQMVDVRMCVHMSHWWCAYVTDGVCVCVGCTVW